MRSGDRSYVIGVAAGIVAGWCLAGALHVMHAQEKPARETRTWHVAMLPMNENYHPVRVDTIDTDGVCLYVLRSWTEHAPAITAVPKTLLPSGAGCQ